MKLQNKCPKYIQRDYPEQAKNWPDFVSDCNSFQAMANQNEKNPAVWSLCCEWWNRWQAPVNESHARGTSTHYKVPKQYPWCIIGKSVSMLSRSVYVSMECSDGDVQTVAEMMQD